MMSRRQNSDDLETFFSFELLVDYIRVEKESKVSDELALGVRLLDFPTLLIYQPQQSSDGVNHHVKDQHAFNRGKSCFFKMNLNTLHTNLCNTPLCAMVLDVKEEIPRLVGTSLISLAKAMDRIRQDVTERGVSTPSSHGERGAVGIRNIMGERIGAISLSYKLLSLGVSLLSHATERRGQRAHTQDTPDKSDVKPSHESTLMDDGCVAVPTDHKPRSQTPQTLKENLEDDLTLFCPPHLFYTNSAEEKSKHEAGDYKLLNLDTEGFTSEDTSSEDEITKIEGASSPVMNRKHEATSRNQDGPNVLGEAVRQLPLLNALLVELSQLNVQNQNQPLSIHPNLSWIYRPASAETSAGNTPRKAQSRPGTGPHRYCSTQVVRPASVKVKDKQEEAMIESRSSSKSQQKKLVYGTTKTFNLRLKKASLLKGNRRECMDLIQNETQSSMAKGKTKSSTKIVTKSKSALNQSSSRNENVETTMQNITVQSALQETVTLKQKTPHGKVHGTQDGYLSSLSERDLKCVYIPSVEGDEKEHHSNAARESESDSHREKTEPSGSSSSTSSFSDSREEGDKEAEYADDFDSLESADACSPDPASSPEASRTKTPKSPVRPDIYNSDSEGFQKISALPVPVKAPSSPQHALRGTRIFQPRTQASALSFSSDDDDDGDSDGSASLQSVRSRTQMTGSSRVGRSSGAESFVSSRGQRSGSTRNTSPARGFSAESAFSFEPQEVGEREDELGSLDFKKAYQHISELGVNKLPGYTM